MGRLQRNAEAANKILGWRCAKVNDRLVTRNWYDFTKMFFLFIFIFLVAFLFCCQGEMGRYSFFHIRRFLHEKTRTGESSIPRQLLDFRIAFTWWLISHRGLITLIKYMCESKSQTWHPTHALPVPVHREAEFLPKRMVVLRLQILLRDFLPEWNSRCGTATGWTRAVLTPSCMTFSSGIM